MTVHIDMLPSFGFVCFHFYGDRSRTTGNFARISSYGNSHINDKFDGFPVRGIPMWDFIKFLMCASMIGCNHECIRIGSVRRLVFSR